MLFSIVFSTCSLSFYITFLIFLPESLPSEEARVIYISSISKLSMSYSKGVLSDLKAAMVNSFGSTMAA